MNFDADANSFIVFPNPLKGDLVSIHIDELPAGPYRIDFVDMKGSILHSRQFGHPGGELNQKFTLSSLKPGAYVVALRGPVWYQKKFIRQ
jgi:hypothetical protein